MTSLEIGFTEGRKTNLEEKLRSDLSRDYQDEHQQEVTVRRASQLVRSPVSESGRSNIIAILCRSERMWHCRALDFREIRVNVSPPETVTHCRENSFCVRQDHSLVIYCKILSRITLLYRIVSKFCTGLLAYILSFRNLAA